MLRLFPYPSWQDCRHTAAPLQTVEETVAIGSILRDQGNHGGPPSGRQHSFKALPTQMQDQPREVAALLKFATSCMITENSAMAE
jgi:hypothetical protein